ncbi:25505_t:CDS:2 [Gigaspora margarita]|uniref:25505_t:CDS:1 n=1 Tax=Gigaspora margarita TaxID=4874 RepID=A0ABN7UTX9_GIGMA|nr:25505_t:CDS:2 [Gigaspora margarita]
MVERANGILRVKLRKWMEDNQTKSSSTNQSELALPSQAESQESLPKYTEPLSNQVVSLPLTGLDNNLHILSHHQLSRKYANESLANYRDRMKK